jgi:hypothetical protein
MKVQPKKPQALKHGGFSSTSILPGEDAQEFEKLHQEVVAELSLHGALEDEIGRCLAHLMWRRKNLGILRVAARAQQRMTKIYDALLRNFTPDTTKSSETAEFDESLERKYQAAEAQAREELGENYALVELGEGATLEGLANELAIQERLDAAIDRCLKRLLFVRGLKSIAIQPDSTPRQRLSASRTE